MSRRKGPCGVWYESTIEYARALRQQIIKILGGKCVRCGFSDWRALQVDHVKGFPGKNRYSTTHRLYALIQKSLRLGTNEYQLLCANCNWIKKYENNETRFNKQRSSIDLSNGSSVQILNTKSNVERIN